MSAHTPGPWVIEDSQIVTAETGIPICDLPTNDEVEWGGPELIAEAEANARLLKTSPKMLAALRQVRRAFGFSVLEDGSAADAAMRAVDAAIAEATGAAP